MEALDTGEPNSRRLRDDRRRIAAEIGPEALLILDEAQYLIERNPREGTNLETFEWLRACAAEGFLSIAFCGDLALLKVVEHLPQLCSRIIRPVIVRQVPKGDMAAVADRSGIRDAGSIDALHAVARHFGGLRDVAQAIAHAGRFAGKGPITLSHIMAAIADLKLQPNGSK